MRSKPILATAASALATLVLIAVFRAPATGASGLVAPNDKCQNESGFRNAAKARRSMVCLTNYARHKKGLKRFTVNRTLTRSARHKAADILVYDDFSHSACGRDFTFWMERFGYSNGGGWTAGENLAWGNGSYGTSHSIFSAWLNSPGHRRAILSRDFEDIGIGIVHGQLSGTSGARIWVQNFGRRG